jgi:hypothetical protein
MVLLRVHSLDLYQLGALSGIPPLANYEYLSAIEKQISDPAKVRLRPRREPRGALFLTSKTE